MAQLKDTVVSGSLRATDTIYGDIGQFKIIKAPTSSNGTTYGPGSANQVLVSNGTSTYWSAPADSSGQVITDTYVKLRGTNTISATNTFSSNNTFTGNIIANGLVSLIKTSTTPVANFIYFQNNAVVASTLMQIGVSGDNKYQGILSKGYYNGTSYTSSEQWVIARTSDGSIMTGGNTKINGALTISGDVVANGLVSLIKTSTTSVANFIYFQSNAVVTSTLMQVGISGDSKYQGILSKGYYNGTTYTASEKWIIARKGDGIVYTPDVFEIGFTGSTANNTCRVRSADTSISLFANSNGYRGLWAYENGEAAAKYIVRVNGSNTVHYNAGYIDGNLLPNATSSYVLGSSNYKWQQIFVENTSGQVGEVILSRGNNGQLKIGYGATDTNVGLWDTRLNSNSGGWLIKSDGSTASISGSTLYHSNNGTSYFIPDGRNDFSTASRIWGITVPSNPSNTTYANKTVDFIVDNGHICLYNRTDSSIIWNIPVLSGGTNTVWPISQGGTGASTAAGAKDNLGLGSSTADIQIGNYSGVTQFFGISGVVEASSQGEKPFLNKRVAMIFKQNGLYMYNSDDTKSIWGIDMYDNYATMFLCQTPKETSPGTEKLSIRLVHKDNDTSGVGNTCQPVYVDGNGKVQVCCSGNTMWPSLYFSSNAYTDSNYSIETANTWGMIYAQVPGKRLSNNTRFSCLMSFRIFSHNNSGTRSAYYDTYTLPPTKVNATTNGDFNIYTTNNVLYNAGTPSVRANGTALQTGDLWFKPI